MENSGNPGGWVCPECGPGVKADEDGCCKHCGRDADPDQSHLAELTARVEKAEAELKDLAGLIEALDNDRTIAIDQRDEARRERDEARAKLAAARDWAAANKPFGGNGTINNEIHASMAEGDRLDAILSDAPALAVVEGMFDTQMQIDDIRDLSQSFCDLGYNASGFAPVTVVVLAQTNTEE